MDKEFIKDKLNELLAVETLQYLNKNWLVSNERVINEQKQQTLRELLLSIDKS